MEYLMTYSWAIVIIVMILAGLLYLGAFNPANWAPRTQPGSCTVVRPHGPGTTYGIKLVGVCQNYIPQYVINGYQTGSQLQVNYLNYTGDLTSAGQNSITVTLWMAFSPPISPDMFSYSSMDSQFTYPGVSLGLGTSSSNPFCLNADYSQPNPYSPQFVNILYQCQLRNLYENQMSFIAFVYNGDTVTLYDGTTGAELASWTGPLALQGSWDNMPSPSRLILLGGIQGEAPWHGYMSNVQVYNTALSSNSISALYTEGIGGDPIDLSNLVGWWPLNGNLNDYSGNDNNAYVVGGTQPYYTSGWTYTYSYP
jgi:hypothetical protein